MESFYFTVFGLIFCVLLMVIYFPKKKVNSLENKIYGVIIIVTLLSCLTETYSFILVQKGVSSYDMSYLLSLKLLFSGFLAWIYFFTIYIYIVSVNNKKSEESLKQFIKNSILLYFLIVAIDVFFLKITVNQVGGMLLPSGSAVNFLYLCGAICIFSMLFIFFKNIKAMKNKKFVPLYLLIVMFGVVVAVQKIFPELLTINAAFVFITFVMYFTIENPDLKIIEELNKNRLLINQIMEEKSNFLFLASNQIKKPIKDIQELSDQTINLNSLEDIKTHVKEISNLSHNLSVLTDNVMDISSLSMTNIKVVNDKYCFPNFIQKIKLMEEKKVPKNVEFLVNMSETVPKYVYGDSKLLEQVLVSLIENAISYTKEGFIELRISVIVKYDMCRFVITIADSGIGMSIDKVNELLLVDEEMSDEELERLETKNININVIKKVVSKLGGYFTLKSDLERGTEVKVVLDQRIEPEFVNVNNYVKKEKVLVASKDIEFLKSITKLIEKKGYGVETSIYANDVIDRIRLHEEYDIIFLDDKLDIRALETLKILKDKFKLNIPVVIMLDKDMEMIKEHFKEDGFSDYLLKDNISIEINRILK